MSQHHCVSHKLAAALLLAAAAFTSNITLAQNSKGNDQITTSVPVNPRAGHPSNLISEGFSLSPLATGTDPLENPSGKITKFGFLNDFPPQVFEATKTEPDENTYLVLDHNPGGPTLGYDYGRRFLIQGHENSGDLAYVTRINLDIQDPAHRITLLTPVGADGKTHFNSIDGSTWNPFTKTLLFTQERGAAGGVIQITMDWPNTITTLNGIIGQAGYEGIHPDDRGNLLLIEDAGGVSVRVDPTNPSSPKAAKQPNSFVYRFVPKDPTNLLAGGKLQALQVSINGQPVVFQAADPVGDTFSDAQLKLHTLGTSWPVRWVTIHDTDVDGTANFDANALAKAAGATPLKRPENAQYLPGSGFNTFFFDTTGDTNSDSGNVPALAARGAWGSIFRVDFPGDTEVGLISIFFLGTAEQSSFDNLAFVDSRTLLAGEDRGDGLHIQLNALDSIWAYDVRGGSANPRRFVAIGRDLASETDAGLLGTPGFQNDGDNESTGVHVSEGGTSVTDMQGKSVNPVKARWFFTQQHGNNTVYEIVRSN
jgi:Alkaline phosphatase PhoX